MRSEGPVRSLTRNRAKKPRRSRIGGAFFLVATHLGSQRCNEVALRFQAAWRHGPDPEPREEMQ
ncbi:hypothetical protein MC64_020615 [Aeromonas caviae]|nr:MAG: hypothetical protein BGO64_13035 [Aeromonas sp. 62-46]PNO57680.1 hypothetical protein MC64_020615 [Aeromonas caviae]BDA14837.1 hypothetical protein KAM339_033780 [Aeromonas caviae]BDS31877.1 hypothetical protein KAM479c_36010 [Aeromonas caviae]